MIYADFQYYMNEFHGSIIPEKFFERNALQASQYLDEVTFGRIDSDVSDKVKNACCALAEVYYSGGVSPRAASGVTSEKVGNYSVSYADAENVSIQTKRLKSTVRLWLGSTGLLYRGLS